MCARFTLKSGPSALLAAFAQLDLGDNWLSSLPPPRYNIAPSQPVATIMQIDTHGPQLQLTTWGLEPAWGHRFEVGGGAGRRRPLVNARIETAATKPSFRDAFRARRCLILADGFYEWRKHGGGVMPMYASMADGRPFAIAGLWEPTPTPTPSGTGAAARTNPNAANSAQLSNQADEYRAKPARGGEARLAGLGRAPRAPRNVARAGPNARRTCSHLVQSPAAGSNRPTCALLTTQPNALMRPIHNRMPVILPASLWESWLSDAPLSTDEQSALAQPFPGSAMVVHEVSPWVNRVRNDSPRCVEPALRLL